MQVGCNFFKLVDIENQLPNPKLIQVGTFEINQPKTYRKQVIWIRGMLACNNSFSCAIGRPLFSHPQQLLAILFALPFFCFLMYPTLGYSVALRGQSEIEVVVHVDEDNSLGVMGNCATQPFQFVSMYQHISMVLTFFSTTCMFYGTG